MRLPGLFLCVFLFLLVSCNRPGKDASNPVIARVYSSYLYQKDLVGMLPPGTYGKDSVDFVKQYIQNWVKQQLVLHQAEDNLSKSQKDFTKELDEYKNSLIVYAYESELISQKLDTVVTEKQMEEYYRSNPDDFELKDNILRVLYVKMNNGDAQIRNIRNLIRSGNQNDRQRLVKLCATSAVNSFLDDSTWLYFNDMIKEIPITTYNQEEYLQNHRYVEFSDEVYTYLINILDFKIKEGSSPYDLEKDNIRRIILNKRKVKLLNDLEQEIYNKALNNKDFEVY